MCRQVFVNVIPCSGNTAMRTLELLENAINMNAVVTMNVSSADLSSPRNATHMYSSKSKAL
ncbi:hypothetical protein TWF481_002810 [Arthrobotrys musiformis]|uniref:Uncharacterized protein n=1 Tax=Arthrobotrys musiformis TaxID=47236 RepID=A0AAV9VSE3_9PEZI